MSEPEPVIKIGVVFFDKDGGRYDTPQDAAASSLAKLMGLRAQNSENGTALIPIARALIDNRSLLESLFADLDQAIATHEKFCPLRTDTTAPQGDS